jgi:hypothetical protein
LKRLTELFGGHQALLVVEHRRGPFGRAEDAGLDGADGEEAVVLVLLDQKAVVIAAGFNARQPHGDVRDRDEQQLVQVRYALAAGAVRRLAPCGVLLEAGEPDVTVRTPEGSLRWMTIS